MDTQHNKKCIPQHRLCRVVGVVLTVVALGSNPWTLARLGSSDGAISSPAILLCIVVFELFLLVPGLYLLSTPKSTELFLRGVRAFPNTAAALFGTAVAGALLVAVLIGAEIICRLLALGAANPAQEEGEGLHFDVAVNEADTLMGYVPLANGRVRARRIHNGETLYDVLYDTDEYRRRRTPLPAQAAPTQFALFFGGSYVFGEGVHADETLPASFARRAPRYRPYNLGFSGYGPQQMLARLTGTDIEKEVTEPRGILVYVFIADHVDRAIGAMHVINNWGGNFPLYALEDNQLIRQDTFAKERPFAFLLYQVCAKSRLVERTGFRYPLWHTQSHMRLVTRMIEESKNAFEEKFNSLGFYLVVYPGAGQNDLPDSCRKELENKGVMFLDYSALIAVNRDEFHIPHDGHPTALAHDRVARALANDIQETQKGRRR